MEKMSRAERAKQFMPFAALHGFEDAIRKRERTREIKRELSDEETENLNVVIVSLKKGDLVEAQYYVSDGYEKITGAITEINFTSQYIKVVKTSIKFSDLYSIKEVR